MALFVSYWGSTNRPEQPPPLCFRALPWACRITALRLPLRQYALTFPLLMRFCCYHLNGLIRMLAVCWLCVSCLPALFAEEISLEELVTNGRDLVDQDVQGTFEALEGALEEIGPDAMTEEAGRLNLYYSMAAGRLDRVEDAIAHAQRTRIIAQRVGDRLLENEALTALSGLLSMFGDYEASLELNAESLEIAEEVGDPLLKYRALHMTGIIYWGLKDWDTTLRYMDEAFASKPESERLAFKDYNNLGVANMEAGRYKRAEELFMQVTGLLDAQPNEYGEALVLSNLGDLRQREQRPGEALRLLELSIEKARTAGSVWVEARSLRHRARALAQLGRLDEAIETGREALRLSREQNQRAEVMDAWELLIELEEDAGNYQAALEAQRAFSDLQSSLLDLQVRNRAILHRVDLETAQKERRIAELEQERIRSRWQLGMLVLVLALTGVLAFVVYQRFRDQRQSNHKLRQLNREKDEFIGIAAHDLRNPIGAVQSLSNLLLEDWPPSDPEESRQQIKHIHDSSTRTLHIVDNLLDINRIEQEGISPKCESIDGPEVIESAIRSYGNAITEKHQLVIREFEATGLSVMGDVFILQQVLDNLISNAVKYSFPGARIWIGCRLESDERVRFSVRDEGPGISAKDMERLFTKFARLDNRPTGNESSVGLGLSITKRLVEAMNGKIWCESSPGKGSTFVFTLPRAGNAG